MLKNNDSANSDWRRRRQPFEDRGWQAGHEMVAIILWFFLSLDARPEESHPMRGKCSKTKRGGRLLPPGRKDKKKEKENRRMTRRARSILPTMLLFSRCYVALFLDYDGTGGRAAYAPLCSYISYISLPLTRCALAISPIQLWNSARVRIDFKHRQMFARGECYTYYKNGW